MDVVGGDDTKTAKKVVHESIHSTTSQSRSGIQSTQSGFKWIRFNNSRKDQAEKLVRDKDIMANLADKPGDTDNCLPFKNNVEYKWTRFI